MLQALCTADFTAATLCRPRRIASKKIDTYQRLPPETAGSAFFALAHHLLLLRHGKQSGIPHQTHASAGDTCFWRLVALRVLKQAFSPHILESRRCSNEQTDTVQVSFEGRNANFLRVPSVGQVFHFLLSKFRIGSSPIGFKPAIVSFSVTPSVSAKSGNLRKLLQRGASSLTCESGCFDATSSVRRED